MRPNTSHTRLFAWPFAAVILLVLTACAKKAQELKVEDGWVRLSPPNSMMTAGYGTFTNTGSTPLTFTSFTSSQFGDITLHYTEEVNGTATMREAHNYSLAPGESLELSPGGYHLMLMRRKEPTGEGTDINITFEFESGVTATYPFTVTKR